MWNSHRQGATRAQKPKDPKMKLYGVEQRMVSIFFSYCLALRVCPRVCSLVTPSSPQTDLSAMRQSSPKLNWKKRCSHLWRIDVDVSLIMLSFLDPALKYDSPGLLLMGQSWRSRQLCTRSRYSHRSTSDRSSKKE